MVRLGIGLYGVNDRTKIFRNVGTLKSVISQIRTIWGKAWAMGEFMAEKNNKVPRFQLVTRMGFRAWETELDLLLASKIKGKNSGGYLDMLMVDVTEMIVPKEIV
jgi:hypothetical protein